jgi:hypothetical protein
MNLQSYPKGFIEKSNTLTTSYNLPQKEMATLGVARLIPDYELLIWDTVIHVGVYWLE